MVVSIARALGQDALGKLASRAEQACDHWA
eukprot:COSAG01_NODE_29900_length_627_cov_1.070076_1_plen_29_part_01